jgi:hypothetical protein
MSRKSSRMVEDVRAKMEDALKPAEEIETRMLSA